MLTSPLLKGFAHGFGTRHSGLTQAAMASVQQIHSDITLIADAIGCIGEGDALLSNELGITVSIRTADCLPILLADPVSGAVAAVHAGWRGTAAGIVGITVRRMVAELHARPENILAAIGPGIGKCCYEVGLDVARKLGESQAGKVDLAENNRRQLLAAGVGQIDVVSPCTFCEAATFYSYRREGEKAGRMISYIETQRAR
ncbi:MAG: peptidoglycan editing factor PgeF [Bryobacteraceae bacterium]